MVVSVSNRFNGVYHKKMWMIIAVELKMEDLSNTIISNQGFGQSIGT